MNTATESAFLVPINCKVATYNDARHSDAKLNVQPVLLA